MRNIVQTHHIPQTDPAYFVGGAVRDYLLGHAPIDYDIAVLGNPEKYARQLAANTAGRLVQMGKPGKMIYRVAAAAGIFDVAPLNGDRIEEDLRRRDFTINALAYNIQSGDFIDCGSGRKDLTAKLLRMVSPQAFENDPIRLVRAYRMAAVLGFTIDAGTAARVKTCAQLIHHSAPERIRTEFFKMLGAPRTHAYLVQMAQSGLLTRIFPELIPLSTCPRNYHHDYDALEHSLQAFAHLEALLHDYAALMRSIGPKIPTPKIPAPKIPTMISEERAALLKCAILLHDIGKPATRTVDHRGRVHYYGHERKGADLAMQIAARLRFSAREKSALESLIRNHLRPLLLYSAQRRQTLTRRGIIRLFIDCGDSTPDLLLHAIADQQAKRKERRGESHSFIAFAKQLLGDFYGRYKPRSSTPPLITGDDLIREFDLKPSPLFKEILNRVEEARLSEKIRTRAAALTLVTHILSDRSDIPPLDKITPF